MIDTTEGNRDRLYRTKNRSCFADSILVLKKEQIGDCNYSFHKMNNFKHFFDDIKNGEELFLYVPIKPESRMLAPPEGTVVGPDGSFIASEIHHEKYCKQYLIFRDNTSIFSVDEHKHGPSSGQSVKDKKEVAKVAEKKEKDKKEKDEKEKEQEQEKNKEKDKEKIEKTEQKQKKIYPFHHRLVDSHIQELEKTGETIIRSPFLLDIFKKRMTNKKYKITKLATPCGNTYTFRWSGTSRFHGHTYANYSLIMKLIRSGRIIRSDLESLLDAPAFQYLREDSRLTLRDINVLFDRGSSRECITEVLDKLTKREVYGKYQYMKVPYICYITVHKLIWLIEL